MSFREVGASERSTIPYSAIGLVAVTWPDGTGSGGSAVVVGRNDILTAAHVVYNPDRGGWAEELQFYFGADYNSSLRSFESYGYRLDSGFTYRVRASVDGAFDDWNHSTMRSSESQYDIALLGVSIEIGKWTGWLGLDPGLNVTQTVNAAGYPGGATGLMTERVTVSSSRDFGVYEGTSQMGQGSSGGPLFTDSGFVIGVMSAGTGNSSTWADLGFSWDWVRAFIDENDTLLGPTSAPVPTYSISATSSSVNEGSTATFTVSTTNVPFGTVLGYSVSGISSSDLTSGSLSGSLTIGSNGQGTISIPVRADSLTEGTETMTVTVQGQSASVVVSDTSRTPVATPTYSLVALSSSVSEGQSATFTLSTTNVAAGTSVAYTISGVSGADIVSGLLSGSVTVGSSGQATISIPVAADNLTEGNETLTVTAQGKSASITVVDSSITPTLTITPSTTTGKSTVQLGTYDSQGRKSVPILTETVFGSDYSDSIAGSETLSQTFFLYDGDDMVSKAWYSNTNDTFFPGKGNDLIFASGGIDSVIFQGNRSSYTVQKSNQKSSSEITVSSSIEGTDALYSVERLLFSDHALAFDTDGVAGKAYRIYKAAFNRDPQVGDRKGLGYWIKQLDEGVTPLNVSSRFVDSNEFRSLYGTNPTNEQFLNKLYTNVLGRQPEASGFNWWLNELNTNPTKTKAKVLADFAESAENQTSVLGLIANGITYEAWVG